MLKYLNYAVTFQEVPNEVSLVLNISNCQYHCQGCHSPELWLNNGSPLLEDLESLIEQHKDMITCVCFMGEGNDMDELRQCIDICKAHKLKTCLYTGGYHWDLFIDCLDYCKFGPYIAELGGLNSPTTNQVFYKKIETEDGIEISNITKEFQKPRE